ncbi:MAG: zinc-ribbon domain-containing protein [Tepidisphaeraceae bacterium]|jgi:tetratricopeptide (TPR) repeat protein
MKRRTGFIFLFGTRNLISHRGQSVQATCPRCGQPTTILGKGARSWFTLFFIPIFPISGRREFSQCSNCGAQFRVAPDQLGKISEATGQKQMQQAIQMYNSMRASPANSVTLNNLLSLYLTMHEYDQATSAANEFQQALNASEQCMTTLGRVLMEQGKIPEAIQWYDAALARNPMLGEAAYCKAVALMRSNPPDLVAAQAAARSARSSGLAEGEQLLHEIENRLRAG